MMNKRLLSVDWDYFFPELSQDPEKWMLYDWGHRDGGSFFLDQLWYHRAGGFLINDLPLPDTTGHENAFWSRFRFTKTATLYYGESHVRIYDEKVYKDIGEVYSFDAHHDGGYRGPKDEAERFQFQQDFMKTGKVTCEDWALAFEFLHGINVSVFYPKWKPWAMTGEPSPTARIQRQVDDEQPFIGKNFHRIFLCRSGGWSPSWLDDKFDQFVETCPVANKVKLDEMTNRQWDNVRLESEMEMQRQAREMVKKANL